VDGNHLGELPDGARAVYELLKQQIDANTGIPQSLRDQLPQAIHEILTVTPDAMGLVQRARPGATPMSRNLMHRTRGAGFAYELVGTAALIRGGSVSVHGDGLRIDATTDRLDFGPKAQARHSGAESQFEGLISRLIDTWMTIGADDNELRRRPRNATLLETLPRLARKTVESDLLICRATDGDFREIGVDFKRTARGRYAGGISPEQLTGVLIALCTGELHEFHFVTNGRLGGRDRMLIDGVRQVARDSDPETIVTCHEFVGASDQGSTAGWIQR